MFGLSAGEFVVLLVVGIVVLGPQKLPGLMRTAGKWVRKLRRMSSELRAQSGIDRILREEGLDKELRELRELKASLSRHAVLDSLVEAANRPLPERTSAPAAKSSAAVATPAPSSNSPRGALSLSKAESHASLATTTVAAAGAVSASVTTPATEGTPTIESPPTSAAARLIRPATGAVARGSDGAKEPSPSIREREYPLWGPDHYEAMPDDLDPEEEALSAGLGQGHGLPEWKPEEPAPAAPIDPQLLEEALA